MFETMEKDFAETLSDEERANVQLSVIAPIVIHGKIKLDVPKKNLASGILISNASMKNLFDASSMLQELIEKAVGELAYKMAKRTDA